MTGPSEAVRAKAARLLAEGRVTVEQAGYDRAAVRVIDGTGDYLVTVHGRRIDCPCPSHRTCAHSFAAGLITPKEA